jgi:hypothetical protein
VIAMSFITTTVNRLEGVEAEYQPAHNTDYDMVVPAYVHVRFGQDHHATLSLKIEDARSLVESVGRILMLHDSVEHLAAEKAVA